MIPSNVWDLMSLVSNERQLLDLKVNVLSYNLVEAASSDGLSSGTCQAVDACIVCVTRIVRSQIVDEERADISLRAFTDP
jgi:hypothetical protein